MLTFLLPARSGPRPSRKLLTAVGMLGLWAAGCTQQADGPADAAAADAALLTASQRGEAVVKKLSCGLCHNPETATAGVLSGQQTPLQGSMAYAANLTPDKATGIGDWSDEDIIKSVRTGIDDQGKPLCPTMPHFSNLSDADAKDLIAYLRSLKAVSRAIPESVCPPVKPQPMDGGTRDAH